MSVTTIVGPPIRRDFVDAINQSDALVAVAARTGNPDLLAAARIAQRAAWDALLDFDADAR